MNDDLTIVYYTASRERPEFEQRVRDQLVAAAQGRPIISVSQEPVELGRNICVGPVGASYRNCYRQTLIGVRAAETEYVAFAEADTLYPAEFFRVPPEGVDGWIGSNLWVVYADRPGQYFHKGPSDGLLVARREWVIARLEQRLEGLPEWGPGKTKPLVGSNAEMAKFDHPPVISFKTGASLSPVTGHSGRVEAHLEPWGSAAELATRLGVDAPYAPREPSQAPSGPYELSILIPARNERFPSDGKTAVGEQLDLLNLTLKNVLVNTGDRTEVIVVLDGVWPLEPIEQHPRLTVVYNPVSVGQRAATNQAARLSKSRWVMKLDGHCAVAPGFDEAMLAAGEGHDDWTLVPGMFNLHAFDWVCDAGHRLYQGPDGACRHKNNPKDEGEEPCGRPANIDLIWAPRKSAFTKRWRFDRNLRFGYGGYDHEPAPDLPEHLVETMSLLGACWMVNRERYWELNFSDEAHGSWGQQGTEVACKTWLSGGRLIVNTSTWFAHLFRTRTGFDYPYPLPGHEVEHARSFSRNLWMTDSWPHAVHPLSWLVEKFAPVRGWLTKPGIVYYTDNRLGQRLARDVRRRLATQAIPIVSATLKPIDLGTNIVVEGAPGAETMFRQILAALELSEADYVFLCEHDVLYHPSHFEFVPDRDDRFYYNTNVWKVRLEDGFAVRTTDCRQTSGLCANRQLLLAHYRERVRRVEAEGFTRAMGFEPGTHTRPERVDDYESEIWESEFPNIDVRHGGNLTRTRWSPGEYRNPQFAEGWQESSLSEIPGWSDARIISAEAA